MTKIEEEEFQVLVEDLLTINRKLNRKLKIKNKKEIVMIENKCLQIRYFRL